MYAGAILLKAYVSLEAVFQSIVEQKNQLSDVEFHFISTGLTPNDGLGVNIKPLPEKYGL